ncbi:hypothetical protein [Streptomyces sp. NBC_01304]|uniref:hypothetical protein n=1 Tax=Streptomyces sp. NBC_01304 TaxID=2903818 RepID=UPI002E13420D|nr:hypothetical protein OG430_02135 [Streptomyces sp. NBC_01304]
MSLGLWIVLGMALAVVAVVWAAPPVRRQGAGRLQRRFGPEYERVCARHGGDTTEADRELAARLDRFGHLRLRRLSAAQRQGFVRRWAQTQAAFADSPRQAVLHAARLVGELADVRGFDAGSVETTAEALSVRYPHDVDSYRKVMALAQTLEMFGPKASGDSAASPGRTGEEQPALSTEQLRQTLIEARGLCIVLLRRSPYDGRARRMVAGSADGVMPGQRGPSMRTTRTSG